MHYFNLELTYFQNYFLTVYRPTRLHDNLLQMKTYCTKANEKYKIHTAARHKYFCV